MVEAKFSFINTPDLSANLSMLYRSVLMHSNADFSFSLSVFPLLSFTSLMFCYTSTFTLDFIFFSCYLTNWIRYCLLDLLQKLRFFSRIDGMTNPMKIKWYFIDPVLLDWYLTSLYFSLSLRFLQSRSIRLTSLLCELDFHGVEFDS